MALESTQQSELIAGRVIALAGRRTGASSRSAEVALRLLHGEADRVMPPALATDAQAHCTRSAATRHWTCSPGSGMASTRALSGARLNTSPRQRG